LESVLIIEDDIEFEEKFFEELEKVLINDFDIIYLNGTDGFYRRPKPYTATLKSVGEMWGMFGYVIHSRIYDEAIKWLTENDLPCDTVFSMYLQFYKCYKVVKPLVFHRAGMSDIQRGIPKNYKHLQRRGKKK